jgi:hypothetical protein
VRASSERDLDSAFVTAVQQRSAALLVSDDQLLGGSAQLVDLASKHAIPTIYTNSAAVTAGGLVSYTAAG